MTVDPIHGQASIIDITRGAQKSIPLKSFEDRTLQHTLVVKYGPSGSVDYKITDAANGAGVLAYKVNGSVGKGGT